MLNKSNSQLISELNNKLKRYKIKIGQRYFIWMYSSLSKKFYRFDKIITKYMRIEHDEDIPEFKLRNKRAGTARRQIMDDWIYIDRSKFNNITDID